MLEVFYKSHGRLTSEYFITPKGDPTLTRQLLPSLPSPALGQLALCSLFMESWFSCRWTQNLLPHELLAVGGGSTTVLRAQPQKESGFWDQRQ